MLALSPMLQQRPEKGGQCRLRSTIGRRRVSIIAAASRKRKADCRCSGSTIPTRHRPARVFCVTTSPERALTRSLALIRPTNGEKEEEEEVDAVKCLYRETKAALLRLHGLHCATVNSASTPLTKMSANFNSLFLSRRVRQSLYKLKKD